MTVENGPAARARVAAAYDITSERRRLSWGAIFAGTIVAVATMIVLGLLGAGIGLWSVEPGGETDTVSGMATGSAIYFVITQIIALFIGGYVAARGSAVWDRQNAVLHGVVVWALATIAAVWFTMSAASAIFYSTMSVLRSSASAVASVAESVVPNELPNFTLPDIAMSDLPPRIQQALRDQGITADNLKSEAREAFRQVISKQEQEAAKSAAVGTATDIIRSPGDAMADIEAGIDRLVGKGGVISSEDRTELINVMESRLGISKSEAEAMIDRWQKRAEQAFTEAKQALETARREAVDAGRAATNALASASFWSFIALLLALVAAGGGAAAGRREHPVEAGPR